MLREELEAEPGIPLIRLLHASKVLRTGLQDKRLDRGIVPFLVARIELHLVEPGEEPER
jgi:hypothetical protein